MNPIFAGAAANIGADLAARALGPSADVMGKHMSSILGKVLGGGMLGGISQMARFPGSLPFPFGARPWPFPFPMPRLPFFPIGPFGCQAKPEASPAGLSTNGNNTIDTGRYLITVKENEAKIFDKQTQTWVKCHGDPHLLTSDGDKGQFHENLTIDLPDGTKVTIKTTDKDARGVSWIDAVAVMKGDEAVVIKGFHDGRPGVQVGNVLSNADAVDAMWEDGTVLRAGRQVDDLTFAKGGQEIVGRDPNARWGEHVLDGHGGESKWRPDAHGKEGIGGTGGAGATGGTTETTGGGSIWDRLWAIISKLEDQLSDKIKEAEGIPEGDTGAMKKVFAEIERIQNSITQITTAMSNLQKADHDAKMAIIRNLA